MTPEELERTLRSLASGADDAAFGMVEALADRWVDVSQQRVPVDTGQTRARTGVESIKAGGVAASATVVSDTPYAGYIEYGTRYQPPRPYFRAGRDAARDGASRLGAQLSSDIRGVLRSGGVWNPRKTFGL